LRGDDPSIVPFFVDTCGWFSSFFFFFYFFSYTRKIVESISPGVGFYIYLMNKRATSNLGVAWVYTNTLSLVRRN